MKKLFALSALALLPSCGGLFENVSPRSAVDTALVLCQTYGVDGQPTGVYVMVERDDNLTGGTAAEYCELIRPVIQRLLDDHVGAANAEPVSQ